MTPKDVKKISIRLLPDGFSFLNQYVPIQPGADFSKRLEEGLLDKLSDLDEEFAIDQFSVENTRFCLSPLCITDSVARQLYEASLPRSEQEEMILAMEDVSRELRFEFGIDKHLYHFILRNWPEVQFTHPIYTLYRQWVQSEAITQDCMVAEVENNALNILVFKNEQLHLANRFEDSGINNATYHILNCWEQCSLDVLDDKLYLSTESDKIRRNLQQYIKQCES